MYVAYKNGEKRPAPNTKLKPKPRKQVIEEMAAALVAKWTARDRLKACKKHGIPPSAF